MRGFGLLIVFALAVAAVLATSGVVAPAPAVWSQEPALAVHNGRLFDGTGAPLIEDGVIVIEGNRIVAVGSAAEVEIPPGAETIDAAGGLIMPGVIDNHVHVTGPLGLQQQDILTPWLRAGVTTLVDTGTVRDGVVIGDFTIADGVALLRNLVDAVAEEPPRVLVAGPLLTAPGGYPATRPEPDSALGAQDVTSPEDGEARVARLLDEQNADLIKVAIEAGFDADYDDPGWPVLPPETLAAIADATHQRGKTVRAHVTHVEEFRAALEAGFDATAHTPIVALPDELLQEAADAGMILVSTANIWGGGGSLAAVQSNLSLYAELGGRVALGTDFPFQSGSEMPVMEMQLLVAGGLTPTEVLIAATKHGAEAVGRGDDLGTLEPGKLADIIVVDGDPLSDIAEMANVSIVIRDGEVIVGEVIQPPPTAAPSPTTVPSPSLTPPPTATSAPSLPHTGRGPADEEQPVRPTVVAVLVATGALLAGGWLLMARRR